MSASGFCLLLIAAAHPQYPCIVIAVVSVGVPQVLLRVLRHEVGGRVGLQVGQAGAAVVGGRRARHSARHAAYAAAVEVTYCLFNVWLYIYVYFRQVQFTLTNKNKFEKNE